MDRDCRAFVISAAPVTLQSPRHTSGKSPAYIFIIARIKPAPEIRCGLFESGRPAKAAGKPNRYRRFRAIAQANLQALAFKHLKPTGPLREGAVTSRAHPKVSRKYP